MRARALLAVAAVTTGLGATAVPASAQTYAYPAQQVHPDAYCAQVRQNRMMTAGAVGAAIGAVLGNNLAAGKNRGDGSILGGVAGAATGAMIGRNTGACSPAAQRAQQGGYGQPQQPAYGYGQPNYGYGQPTYGDRYPLEGGPDYGYRTSGNGQYGGTDPNCRWGTVSTRDPDGREVRDSIYMCRGRDGVWRAQQPY
jgi:hypothetical protein